MRIDLRKFSRINPKGRLFCIAEPDYSIEDKEAEKFHKKLMSKKCKKAIDLLKLRGLGKELWRGEDAQEYTNKLRRDK